MDKAHISFQQFTKVMLSAGYDQVVERIWEPNQVLDEHTHPFDVNVIVVQGEVVLTVAGEEPRKLLAGDTFSLAAKIPHSEQYGPEGAVFWVARKGEIPS